MSIRPGSRVGPYEVTVLIGEGGMGKVWRARHTALKRDDALKVLSETFADDPDRLARFQREAEVLASLNHPNIAAIYGLEESPEDLRLRQKRFRTGRRTAGSCCIRALIPRRASTSGSCP